MGNVAVINLTKRNQYHQWPFFQGESVMDRVLKYRDSLPDIDKTFILLSEHCELDTKSTAVVDTGWTEEKLFSLFNEQKDSCDNLFYFWGDYPLLDAELTGKMYENHIKYYAGYTFADGYPLGFAPEILRSSDIEMLYNLSRGSEKEIGRNSLFEVLQKDINAFDIETDISPVDLRMYRIQLSCDTKRNSEQLKGLIDRGIIDSSSLLEKIDSCRDVLRTKPSYYQIQIVDSCPQRCSYCPFGEKGADYNSRSEMELAQYTALLDRIVDFSDDAYIALSAWGEPSHHQQIVKIVEETLKRPSLKILLETSGIGWTDEALEQLASFRETYKDRLSWIVSLDSLDKDLYRKLRGQGYDEAWERAHRLLELFGENCWVQAVRMHENEENLEEFYRYWKKITENIIVQKYDWFCGSQEQKKITDLSPLNRDPCWHLKRDLFIELNGNVPLCREDLKSSCTLGNVYTDTLDKIWKNGEKIYLDHLKGEYSPLCGECDEYYTFNF